MSADRQDYVSPMQQAFVDACFRINGDPKGKLTAKVLRALERTRPLQVRAVNAKVSYRTAQQLKQQGVL